MKVVYHLSQMSDDALVMSIKANTPQGEKKFITTSRQKVGTLSQLHALCKNNISTILWKNGLGSGHYIEWDEDPTDIISMPIIGLNTYKKKIKVEPVDVTDMVYEVIKVDETWTVIKHDSPLLTWSEAVEELKKRI